MIFFKKVKDPYGWLSNMSPHKVGQYRTAEAYFQAHRFDDEKIRDEIRNCTSPMTAKMTAKTYRERMVVLPQTREVVTLMYSTVRLKLVQHMSLQEMLLATGEEQIVEDVSSRPNESGLFWGAYLKNGKLCGQNQLGVIWMELRTQLRYERSNTSL